MIILSPVTFFFKANLFIYLWLCWVFISVRRAFSSRGKWGPLFIAVRGPLTIAASLVEEHKLQTRRLSNCGSRAQSLCGMWDLPRPGLEPVSPALAGRFSTTAPPGKPPVTLVIYIFLAVPHSTWDFSFPTRDWTRVPAVEVWSPNQPIHYSSGVI